MAIALKNKKTTAQKKIVPDKRNYFVTQPYEDTAANERDKLAAGITVGQQKLSFSNGVLTIKKL